MCHMFLVPVQSKEGGNIHDGLVAQFGHIMRTGSTLPQRCGQKPHCSCSTRLTSPVTVEESQVHTIVVKQNPPQALPKEFVALRRLKMCMSKSRLQSKFFDRRDRPPARIQRT